MNEKPYAFVLYGNPVTKKNSPVMVKGRSVLLPSEAYRKYESSCRKALQVLKVQEKLRHFSMGVSMCCLYYLESKAHYPDLLGLLQATADLLEVSTDDLLGRKEPRLKDNLMKIKNKIMLEVNKQNKQWGDESELTPHQWLGLIQEEVGEIAQALNETYLPNKTKAKLGGKENIQAEIYQAAALLIRFSERIEGE